MAGFALKPSRNIATRPATLSGMSNECFIAARVSHEMKAQLRSLAHEQQQSESAVIKNLLDSLVGGAVALRAHTITEPAVPRGARFYVRLQPEDQRLLRERAAARSLAPATYLAMLSRAHLRELSPLPREELAALKTVVGQLSAFGRNLNLLVRALNQGAKPPDSLMGSVQTMLRICQALHDHVKHLVKVNAVSWRTGNGSPNS